MMSDMLNVVVALKGGPSAKSRLAPAISPAERDVLWQSMASHVLATLSSLTPPARWYVVTACPQATGLALRHGAEIIVDSRQGGTAAAYEQAIDVLGPENPALLLNGDLPFLELGDLEAMVEDSSEVAIAPDGWGVGTNALFLPAGSPMRPQFGPDSFARHLAWARAAGVPYRVVRRQTIAHDVDEPADLQSPARPLTLSSQHSRGARWPTC